MNANVVKQWAAALIVAAIAFAGCKKEDDSYSSVITMTTAQEGKVWFALGGSGEAVINWNDGSASETFTLTVYSECTHTFSDTTSRTITINGKNIWRLDCFNLQLTALDVSNNTVLTSLSCSSNRLTSLNVTGNTVLTYLDCSNNQLTSIDVSSNTALGGLNCSRNRLTGLNVTGNTAVIGLDCSNNQLTSIDVSSNTALEDLHCSSNQLTSLNVSNNTALTILLCNNNQLDADGLNALFGTLHSNDAGTKSIYYRYNPGDDDCDRSIATAKGWKVEDGF